VAVFGKDKRPQEEQEEQKETQMVEDEPTKAPAQEFRLDPAIMRAVGSIIRTVDMFKDTAHDVIEAEGNEQVSMAELKDLVSRCKSYSLIVEKEFKIMRRRMQAK